MYFSFETIPAFVWAFITAYVIYSIINRRLSKNDPPMVPYKIPIIGHTIDYLFNAENFFAECRQKYGDPFNIYVFGQVITIAGNEIAHEVFRSETFSLPNAMLDRVLKSFGDPKTAEQVVKTIREGITAKLPLYTRRLQRQLMFSFNKEIGDCSNPKFVITAKENFSSIIARPIADILVGQEISKNEDVVKAFANFTKDFGSILKIPPILSFIHPKVHTQIITLPFRFGWNPKGKHVITFKKYLKPELEKRLKDKEILGDKYEPPVNFAGRPELWDDIYEEQVRINKECNGELLPQHVDKMVKLDTGSRHKCLESYTLKNGMTIPKGRKVQTYLMDIHYNTTAYGPEPRSFLPYHGLENNLPASKIDKNFFPFGSGKHVCPGRFLAVNKIKVALHILILKYHIKTPSGKTEKKVRVAALAFPPVAGLIFENRKNR
ncbi:1517_t:CDS:10 [Diversispora eburnea]|uniref:1517_t:CDS:1 n=1 Tax=Diversispora eburnea TaxID=1213867 RepID=A0A9N8VWF1_9GLOM|nr:1517_t:CDS:10 [Diversispora eburnea]